METTTAKIDAAKVRLAKHVMKLARGDKYGMTIMHSTLRGTLQINYDRHAKTYAVEFLHEEKSEGPFIARDMEKLLVGVIAVDFE